MSRGQAEPMGAVVTTVIVAILAYMGVFLFSRLNQTISITGPFAGTGQNILTGGANALPLAVGGTGLAVTAVLILMAARR